jgi:hypothetical protein
MDVMNLAMRKSRPNRAKALQLGARRRIKRPVLSLSQLERRALRQAHLTTADLARQPAEEVAALTRIPFSRCTGLCASALFQTLSSVGPSIAADIVRLGYTSLDALAKANPAEMFAKFSRKVGRSVDPCVEDTFRCAVAQARNPALPKSAHNWWYWLPYRGTDVVDVPKR